MEKKIKFNSIWVIVPAVTAIIVLVLYYLKGVYPFGNASVLTYDWYSGTFPASFLHIYDAWHSGSLFYDYTTALGFSRNILLTLLQPQYVFALFWERENLVDAMAILLLLKFVTISFTSTYSFLKIFPKVSDLWVLCGALMYTFCGFNIQYYFNIDWLDTVALFPLLIVFTLDLFKGKNKIPFFLVLAYLLITNVYTAFFVVLALIVFGGLYIFIIEEKENRKAAVYNLGVGTGAALIASASSIWGFVSGILSTKRFGMNTASSVGSSTQDNGSAEGFLSIIGSKNQIDIVAVFMFLGMAISIASLIVLWFRFKNHKDSRKYTIFFSITMLLFVLQIVFMGVMLVWHVGSYQKFPFRNGYMVSFFCVCVLLYYQQNFGNLEGVKFKRSILNLLPLVPCFFIGIVFVSYASVFYTVLKNNYNVLASLVEMQTGAFEYPYACFAILLVIGFIAIKFIYNKNLRNILSIGIVIIILFANFNCIMVVTKPEYVDLRTKESIYELELDVKNNVKDYDALSRVNNTDVTMFSNYGYLSGIPTLSNWTHTLTSQQVDAVVDLGYTNSFTLLMDSGGTVFSDALLRITNSFAEAELDERIYEKYATSHFNVNYYKNRFVFPVGLVCDETIKDISAAEYRNTFEYQNAIYRSISNDGEDLFIEIVDATTHNTYGAGLFDSSYDDGENTNVKNSKDIENTETEALVSSFEFPIDGENVLYFAYKSSEKQPPIKEIWVNNEPFYVSDGEKEGSLEQENASAEEIFDNIIFPVFRNNNVLNLGVFEDETVNVSVEFSDDDGNSDSLILYTMSLDKMKKLCDNFDRKEYSVEKDIITFRAVGTEEANIVFIPLGYSRNWECTVNGKSVEPSCVLGNFIGVEIDKGENDVVLTYSHKTSYERVLLLLLLFLTGLGVLLVERKIKVPEVIYKLTFIAFILVFISGILVLYIAPVGCSLVTEISNIIK